MKQPALTLLLLMTLLLGACGETPPPEPPKVGEALPPLTLNALDGGTLKLDSLRGKLVILHVWATWCPPCRKEMPGLERLSRKLDPQKFALIGLSVDEDANLVREFRRKYGITFARHLDPQRVIAADTLGVNAYPETFLITPDGTLLRRMVGEHEWDSPAMLDLLENSYAGKQTKTGAYW